MKSWHIALAALVLGGLVGYGITWYEFAGITESFAVGGDSSAGGAGAPAKGPRAKVEGGTEYSFESMIVGATKSHEFRIRNTGIAPLTLEVEGKPSCQCTQFEVPKEPIPPGEVGKVFLEWKPKDFNPEFSQTATIRTNDPVTSTIRLSIRGRVLQLVRPVPGEVTLSGISTNEERSVEIKLFGYTEDELKIASYEFTEPDSADHFEARWEPLSPQDIAGERYAKFGIRGTITAKSGLPLGAINQTIRVKFAGAGDRQIEIPVKGSVASDISILGGENFEKEKNTLRLGLVKGAKGSKAVLRLMFKGPHRSEAPLKLGAIDPAEALKVTLGAPNEIGGGKILVYLLTIEVPPGSPPVNRIASPQNKPGKILIETPLPDLKELSVLVSFAVEE